MKTSAALCILAALAISQVSGEERRLGPVDYAIQRLKSEATAIVNDLTRLERSTKLNVEGSLSNIKHEGLSRVNGFANEALNKIRVLVDAAKEQGKNVEHCYVTGEQEVNSIRRNSYKVLDKCSEDSVDILKPALNNVEAAIEVGNQLIINLDAIFVDCYSPDAIATEMCAASRVPGAGVAVRKLRESSGAMHRTVEIASKNAELRSRTCTEDAVSVARNDIFKVLLSSNHCVVV